ncbi:MAG: response regulator [Ignavibacteriales bacterium]|nr:MAG: response regulator [Ignavibacteriales bacterium]
MNLFQIVSDRRGKRIIVVEDISIVSVEFQNFLYNNGYRNVKVFPRGRDAIENINLEKPDRALLDVQFSKCKFSQFIFEINANSSC